LNVARGGPVAPNPATHKQLEGFHIPGNAALKAVELDRAAFTRVKANHGGAGVDHQTIERYENRLEQNLIGRIPRLYVGTGQSGPDYQLDVPGMVRGPNAAIEGDF
jgi:hypothetical protein